MKNLLLLTQELYIIIFQTIFIKKQTIEFLLILPHWKVWEKNIPVSFFFNLDNYSHFKFKIFTLKCH